MLWEFSKWPKQPGTPCWLSHGQQGPKHLDHHLLPLQEHLQGTKLEFKHPELELML